jgi:putrescine transport system substrate-binding protein
MLLLLTLVACGRTQPSPAGSVRELNIFSWSDFLAPDVLADFEKESGIKVNLVNYPSQEVLEATLLTGHTNYDVAVVAGDFLGRLVKAHVFSELDRAQLANWSNLDAEVMARLATEDAGNRFAVPYDWGATGIAYNVDKLKQLSPDAPLHSWRLIFDPSVISRYASCGISIIDSPNELVGVALIANGKDPNTTNAVDVEAAARRLMAIRRYVRKIDSDMQIADLASGDICLMVTWPTIFVQAQRRASEVGGHDQLRFEIPTEGATSWLDAFAIPADAPHPAEAHAFINYMMRADVAARGANFLGNASANKAALPLIQALLRDDPSIYPPAAVRQALQPLHARTEATSRVVTRVWTEFRTGH